MSNQSQDTSEVQKAANQVDAEKVADNLQSSQGDNVPEADNNDAEFIDKEVTDTDN